MNNKMTVLSGLILSSAALLSAPTWAEGGHHFGKEATYEVTLTNLTPGQPIAPLMVTTHRSGRSFFQAGEAPSEELAMLAEAGNGLPMAEKLREMPYFSAAEVGSGGTRPGLSSTVTITGHVRDHLSLGAMLGNTNDAFVALSDVDLPKRGETLTYLAPAYDAGSETNDEFCASVPGPACGGEALSPQDSGEGFVTIHNGIHGIGGLDAALYDWRNPVAKVVIKRVQ
ncbi:MAG: spondin domain-containing protein [Hahellaceae bacterium]|nr:spondin domain-containing protein [Hahellaceae bacterium]MCP5168277.1 spondin domain-containing protein [Hahellaceae bacterium]